MIEDKYNNENSKLGADTLYLSNHALVLWHSFHGVNHVFHTCVLLLCERRHSVFATELFELFVHSGDHLADMLVSVHIHTQRRT